MEFEDISTLRGHNPAWRLLRADNAPMILSFLDKIFVEENARSVAGSELISRLDDELYALNERLGANTFPKSPKAYLDDWASPESGWLRKYYPPGSDEPHFDATPAVEKALSWVKSLQSRSFIGTESRLNTIVSLLQEMVFGAERDPSVRLAELNRRRQEVDDEIAKVTEGRFDILDESAQRDRYQQFSVKSRPTCACSTAPCVRRSPRGPDPRVRYSTRSLVTVS
jgi:hypothetical protein